ncbi:MAG TPA: 2Fe-2S iron-sulfur cluster-binding protein [Acetobacteraceae bacterium]|nr:2Fe-2S iron-sulfur cluster-binding protein [Acetobacteraceae bacterium]
MPQPIALNVNGENKTVRVEAESMLLYALPDNLGLHGPKFGCGLGECGACTVIMNGFVIRSCVMPGAAAENAKIITLEGLGTQEKPHKLQKAFIAEQAALSGMPGDVRERPEKSAALGLISPPPPEGKLYAWLAVHPDDTTTLFTDKVETGPRRCRAGQQPAGISGLQRE